MEDQWRTNQTIHGDKSKQTIDVKIEIRRSCIRHPDREFLHFWNLFISLLLIYVAFVTPFRVCFAVSTATRDFGFWFVSATSNQALRFTTSTAVPLC